MKHNPDDYRAIWYWNLNVMASSTDYARQVQRNAAEMGAPLDATYHRSGRPVLDGWSTTDKITCPSARHRMGLKPIEYKCPGGCDSTEIACKICGEAFEHGYQSTCAGVECGDVDGRLHCVTCLRMVTISMRGVIDEDGRFARYVKVIQPWTESTLLKR